MDLELARRLHRPADSKILWLVLDGLGGLPHPESGRSELETAHTPHLDALAAESALGLSMPVGYGITPGSGPGHLALFGYDPLQFDIGRGVLEATGIGFALEPSDVAARGNFCTLAADGTIGIAAPAGCPASSRPPSWSGCAASAWMGCRCSSSRCGSIVSCSSCGAPD